MAEQITTPEALDALPVGSVVLGSARIYDVPVVGQRIAMPWDPDAKWRIDATHYYTPHAARGVLGGSAVVLYRPDAPVPALPDEDRGILRDEAERAILAVWADVPGGVDAGTLADNIVRFQTGALAARSSRPAPSVTAEQVQAARIALAESQACGSCASAPPSCAQCTADVDAVLTALGIEVQP